MTETTALVAVLAAFVLSGCNELYWVCEPTDEERVSKLPEKLGATGLYADIRTFSIATDVRSFAPQFALWADGADKQRWVQLPAGERIDTSDMNDWRFPAGTSKAGFVSVSVCRSRSTAHLACSTRIE